MKNRRIPLACCLPFVVVTLTGCQQSSSGPLPEDASLLAPSVDTAAKGDAAKPIRILSGQLIFDRATDTHSIDLKGTQGLRLAMTVVDFLASFAPTLDCPCVPGDVVRVDAFFVGSSGGWQLRGKTFSVGDPMDPTGPGAGLQFTGGTVVLPPIPEDQTAVLSAPFEFTGTLFSGDFTTPAETLIGQGVATLHFGVTPLGTGEFAWRTTRVVYDFTH